MLNRSTTNKLQSFVHRDYRVVVIGQLKYFDFAKGRGFIPSSPDCSGVDRWTDGGGFPVWAEAGFPSVCPVIFWPSDGPMASYLTREHGDLPSLSDSALEHKDVFNSQSLEPRAITAFKADFRKDFLMLLKRLNAVSLVCEVAVCVAQIKSVLEIQEHGLSFLF